MAFAAANEDTQMFDIWDPLAFQAMTQNDPNLPIYMDALTGPDWEGFFKAMQNKIKELKSKNMWTLIQQSEMKKIGRQALPSMWVF